MFASLIRVVVLQNDDGNDASGDGNDDHGKALTIVTPKE